MAEALLVSADEVRAVLAPILSSERFRRSRRARELLAYLVEETLAGRGDGLKAFTIAVDVFGKDETFNAEKDTLVRVQAGRLRDMLERYFEGEGRDSTLVIHLPKGNYLPHFERRIAVSPAPPAGVALREDAPSARTAGALHAGQERGLPNFGFFGRWQGKVLMIVALLAAIAGVQHILWSGGSQPMGARPPVVRLLIAQSSPDAYERAVLHSIRDIASRFTEFETVTRDEPSRGGDRSWPEDYRIRVENVALGNTQALSLSALHVASGTVVGSVRTNLSVSSGLGHLVPLERAMIKLLQPLGPIWIDYQRRNDYSSVMRCLLLKEDYIPEQSDERHEKARKCVEDLMSAGVEDPRLYSTLSQLHLEEYTDQRNPRPGDPIKRAMVAAQRAIDLAPASGDAHERLMSVYALTGDFDLMVASGKRAIELNPSNSSALDHLGARLTNRGRHEEALSLLLRAEALQPVAPRWRAYAFFLAHYGQGQMQEAIERASTLSGSNNPVYLAAQAIVSRYKGDAVERNEALIALAKEERSFLTNPRAMYERRQYAPALIDKLVNDLTDQGAVSRVP